MPSNPRHRNDYPQLTARDADPIAPAPDGNARRRARTRDALITTAQSFLGEGNLDPAIQAITDRAQVGFGSFFNHFSSKQELLEAASEQAFRTTDAWLSAQVAQVEDPLERVVVQMRLFGRLPEIDPTAARVIAYAPTDTFAMYSGYDLGFERDVERAKESGRLPRPEGAVVRNTFAWGAFKHLLLLRVTDSDHPVEWVDEFTELTLQLFGIDSVDAHRLAHAPLPEFD